jgi:MoaA/NifB/PqqE/SkfB family radical SAM enzyme
MNFTGLPKLANLFPTQENILPIYSAIKDYLPRDRFRQFTYSWIFNNLIVGPQKRRGIERTHGISLPGVINISPTLRCNLHCLGCYASSYVRSAEMSAEQIEWILSEAKELGIRFIGILGGEPLLRKDLFPVFERHKDVAFRISTNGTLLDPSIVESLKRAGNVVLFFSLEGFKSETDHWRGEGVFHKIEQNMLLLKGERILFGFSALVHAQNKDLVVSREFLDLMENLGNRFGLYFPYGPVGEDQYFQMVLNEEEVGECFEKLASLERDYAMLLISEGYVNSQRSRRYFLNQGCRAGLSVHITPEGNVEPCNGIQFYTDNVFQRGLREIFASPFYKDISSCVIQEGDRCIVIREPAKILQIVERHRAKESNKKSLSTLCRYARVFSNARTCELTGGV